MPHKLSTLNGLLNNKYWIEKELGRGRFCQVYGVIVEQTNERLAAKCVLDFKNSTTLEKTALEELKTVYGLVHSIDSFRHLDRQVFIMERCLGDLTSLTVSGKKPLGQTQCLQVVFEMTNALEGLHGKGFLHRNIEPKNILLKQVGERRGRFVLCDFGAAAKFMKADKRVKVRGDDYGVERIPTATWRMARRMEPAESEDLKMVGYTVLSIAGLSVPTVFPELNNLKKRHLEEEPEKWIETQFTKKRILPIFKKLMSLDYGQPVNYEAIRQFIRDGNFVNWDDEIKYTQSRNGPICLREPDLRPSFSRD